MQAWCVFAGKNSLIRVWALWLLNTGAI